eukprot:UN07541
MILVFISFLTEILFILDKQNVNFISALVNILQIQLVQPKHYNQVQSTSQFYPFPNLLLFHNLKLYSTTTLLTSKSSMNIHQSIHLFTDYYVLQHKKQ